MSNTQASGIDFVKRYTELRKEFNMVDALRKLQIESSTPPQEPSAKAIAEAAFNAGVDWRNGIITYGAVTNPFPDKEQYLSKFK